MASTPAQHFHMLRRQMKRNFRKPLIVMTPKSMLRAKLSPLDDLIHGRFHEVLDDATQTPERVRRVLMCSGKVYHELARLRTKTETDDVAIVRVEQFYPFPEEALHTALARYPQAEEYVWVQEESQNMGGWWFMEPRLRAMGYAAEYVGRDASASPATGSHEVHKREQEELVEAAVRGAAPHLVRASCPGHLRLTEKNGNGAEARGTRGRAGHEIGAQLWVPCFRGCIRDPRASRPPLKHVWTSPEAGDGQTCFRSGPDGFCIRTRAAKAWHPLLNANRHDPKTNLGDGIIAPTFEHKST